MAAVITRTSLIVT